MSKGILAALLAINAYLAVRLLAVHWPAGAGDASDAAVGAVATSLAPGRGGQECESRDDPAYDRCVLDLFAALAREHDLSDTFGQATVLTRLPTP
jgi:hypothetical protein